jgi:hypothetical protein
MKNPFERMNAKPRQEFWLDLEKEDRIGILELAMKDTEAQLFLENIRMSESIDPDDAWVHEGLDYCERKGGLSMGKKDSILNSLQEHRDELRHKIEELGGAGFGAFEQLADIAGKVFHHNNAGDHNFGGLVDKFRDMIPGGKRGGN